MAEKMKTEPNERHFTPKDQEFAYFLFTCRAKNFKTKYTGVVHMAHIQSPSHKDPWFGKNQGFPKGFLSTHICEIV